jgi:hypothetical protein
MNEYDRVAPYWMVTKTEATYGEGAHQPIYDSWALFQAKALILKQNAGELSKFIDAPSVAVGDLYYIQNLVSLIEAGT